MAKRTIKINIKLPKGVIATRELTAKATKAANDAVAEASGALVEAQKLVDFMAKSGVRITVEEILTRKKGKASPSKKTARKATRKAAAKGKRTRVVLNDAKKQALLAELKDGAKATATAKKYGVSNATVMKMKREAGLTKPRKKA